MTEQGLIMKSFLIFAVVLAFTAAAEVFNPEAGDWVDYRLNSGYADTDPPTEDACVIPGNICGGCKDLYLCDNSTGKWDVSWLGKCENSQTCNNGICGDIPNSGCALEGKEFQCVSLEGVYPDPGSCTTFHYCIPDSSGVKKIESSCGTNSKYGYNPRTTYCDIPLTNNKCGPSSVPICTKPGQTAALKENPTMYFICKPHSTSSNELYPFLYTCPNGRSYNGNLNCNPK